MTEPWFLWLAFQAAHDPFMAPPPDLHSYGDLSGAGDRVLYMAMVEAMDREIGRLLDTLPADVRRKTLVIFIGDNGTPRQGLTRALARAPSKSTVYELGVHVPMIVSGPLVAEPGRMSDALVHTNDIFTTVLDVAGVPYRRRPAGVESTSFLPQILDPAASSSREIVFSETFAPNGRGPYRVFVRMVRDEQYKLIAFGDGGEELYDLQGALVEGDNLLDGTLGPKPSGALEDLRVRMNALLDDSPEDGS